MRNTAVVMDEGINILLENLGVIETELFISTIIKEPFDYTEWQRKHYANIDLHEFNMRAAQFDKDNPVE